MKHNIRIFRSLLSICRDIGDIWFVYQYNADLSTHYIEVNPPGFYTGGAIEQQGMDLVMWSAKHYPYELITFFPSGHEHLRIDERKYSVEINKYGFSRVFPERSIESPLNSVEDIIGEIKQFIDNSLDAATLDMYHYDAAAESLDEPIIQTQFIKPIDYRIKKTIVWNNKGVYRTFKNNEVNKFLPDDELNKAYEAVVNDLEDKEHIVNTALDKMYAAK